MHPELLNNSLFLKYYKQWQDDPSSIVFAPIAEYFLIYGMVDDALKVCREGLKQHPELVSGRIVMARIHMRRGNWEEALAELNRALSIVPENPMARRLVTEIGLLRNREKSNERAAYQHLAATDLAELCGGSSSWNTMTMANVFASQGHYSHAREIYRSILDREPDNEAARKGMASLPAAE